VKAFNVVRFRVKPGFEESFVEHHRNLTHGFLGFLGGSLFRTGDRSYCITGEWRSYDDLVAARPRMVASLDGVRHMLEELGEGLGVTDPVSGEVVASLAPTPGAPPTRSPVTRKKATKKKAAKKKATQKKVAKKKVAKKAAPGRKKTQAPARKKAKAPARKKAKTPARKQAKRKTTRRRR
jgi:hypothetical protein